MRLFEGKLSVDKVFETVKNMGDKLVFTSEEKAEFNMKIADKASEFVANTLNENSIRSITRRWIALSVILTTLFTFILCVVMVLIGKKIDPILELVDKFEIGLAFILVLGFYFGFYYIQNLLGAKKKK